MAKHNLYQISDANFIDAVKSSTNTHQALVKLGKSTQGGAYLSFKKRCIELNLDLSHFNAKIHSGSNKFIRSTITDEQFTAACANNKSRASTLKELGLKPETGANIAWFNYHQEKLNINTSHWLGQGWRKDREFPNERGSIPLTNILVENSTYTSNDRLKKRLVNEGILEYKCAECSIVEWNGKQLSLHLEHKNGNHTDNRLENICFLCPNCHSQTATYCRSKRSINITATNDGQIIVEKVPKSKITDDFRMPYRRKSNRKSPNTREITLCEMCNAPTATYAAKLCRECFNANRPTKVPHPSKEELARLLWEKPTQQLAKDFGVSDKAIEKWAKQHGLSKPPRGYWVKKKYGKI